MSEDNVFNFRDDPVITLYAGDVKTFFEEVNTRSLGSYIHTMYEDGFGYAMPRVKMVEIKYMVESIADLLVDASADSDAGIKLEYIPTKSGEATVMVLCSTDPEGITHASYTILLPWERAKTDASGKKVIYRMYEDDPDMEDDHPSQTVQAYADYIRELLGDREDFEIRACALFYNTIKTLNTDIITGADAQMLEKAPVFYITDKKEFAKYIEKSTCYDNGIHSIIRMNRLIAQSKTGNTLEKALPDQDEVIKNPSLRKKYAQIVIHAIGENAWKKLDPESRQWILSSLFNYDSTKEFDESLDFSGTVLQVCKVVETYFRKRLFTDYIEYLREKDPENFINNLPYRLRAECEDGELQVNNSFFTLGLIPYLMGMDQDGNIENREDYERFRTYLKEELLEPGCKEDIDEIMRRIVRVTDRIRVEYRNKAAHSELIDIDTAKECLDYCFLKDNEFGRLADIFKRRMDEYELLRENGLKLKVNDDTDERLDRWLTDALNRYSRTSIRKAIDEGFVKINGREAVCNHKVNKGDLVEIAKGIKLRRFYNNMR